MEVGGDDYDYGAFIQRVELRPTPRAPEEPSLPLQGLTFAVKDMYVAPLLCSSALLPPMSRHSFLMSLLSLVVFSLFLFFPFKRYLFFVYGSYYILSIT